MLALSNPLLLLPALPWCATSLLSNYQPYYNIGFQYPSYAFPFIINSFLFGFNKLKSNEKSRGTFLSYNRTAVYCLTASLIFFYLMSPLSPSRLNCEYSPAYLSPNRDAHSELVRRLLDEIPRHASVLTQDDIFTHLSSRADAFVLPPPFGMEELEWNRSMEFYLSYQPDYVLLDASTDHHGVTNFAFGWIEENDYTLEATSDEIYLYRRISLKDGSRHPIELPQPYNIRVKMEDVDLP